jgi:hypothetical protein
MAIKKKERVTSITIEGDVYQIRPPPTFIAREDVIGVWSEAGQSSMRSRRAAGFAIGSCVPEVARAARAQPSESDPWAFGGKVYSYLREQAVDIDVIMDAAVACHAACIEALSPRKGEVEAAVGFSGPSEGPPT